MRSKLSHDHHSEIGRTHPRVRTPRDTQLPGLRSSTACRPALIRGALMVMAVIAIVAVPASASASGVSSTAASVRPASVFIVPSASRCVTGGRLTLDIREPHGVSFKSVAIRVDGRVFMTLRRLRTITGVTLHGLPGGSFTLSVSANEHNGRTVRFTVAYRSCSAIPNPCGCVPRPPVPTPRAPTPPAPAPGPFTPAPGAYTAGVNWMTFYVSPDSGAVQDVKVNTSVSCSSGGSLGVTFILRQAPIESSSSGSGFSGTEEESAIVEGRPAEITYSFEGHFEEATKASGTFRENVAFEDGSHETCTTDNQPFNVTIESEGSQAAEPPRPGSYAAGVNWMTFYVSPASSAVQDVTVNTSVSCSSGGSLGVTFILRQAPIESSSSGSGFSGTEEESAIIGGRPAEITYILEGHFHGFDAGGAQRAAGTFREDVAFEDGSHETCTTDNQPFDVTIEREGSQAAEPPLAGTYAAGVNWMSFNVSPGGEKVESVRVNTAVDCSTGGSEGRVFLLKEAPIETDSSGSRFSGTEKESALIGGKSVEITYTIEGHFHGFTVGGKQRAAGTFREDVAYEDGSDETCTTNAQPFTVN